MHLDLCLLLAATEAPAGQLTSDCKVYFRVCLLGSIGESAHSAC